MKREDFQELVRQFGAMAVNAGRPYFADGAIALGAVHPLDAKGKESAAAVVMEAWDAQAAEVERLRAEVEALRVGVPLTAENAPRARVVEDADGNIWHATMPWWRGLSGAKCHTRDFLRVVVGDRGATVLAWRRT